MSIAFLPDNDAGRMLRLLVDRPGQLDAEALGQVLFRPVLRNPRDYLAFRAQLRDNSKLWTARASALLGRGVQQGLVEPLRPYMISDDCVGTEDAHVLVASAFEDTFAAFGGDHPTAEALVRTLVQRGPLRVRDWVRAALPDSGESISGATKRAIARLVEAGIVVPPTFRWPTEKGVALVESFPAPAPRATPAPREK